MHRSYTQIFRIFGAVIIFLQISKVAALFKIQKLTKSHCSLSHTDSQAPLVSDINRTHGGAVDSGRPKRAGGEAPTRRTIPA